jgi:hypothetical protein
MAETASAYDRNCPSKTERLMALQAHVLKDGVLRRWCESQAIYPLVNVYKQLWKDPPFSMGTSTMSMAIFSSWLVVN